jgi:hypothetical protein
MAASIASIPDCPASYSTTTVFDAGSPETNVTPGSLSRAPHIVERFEIHLWVTSSECGDDEVVGEHGVLRQE